MLNIGDNELTKAVLQFCPLPRADVDAEEFLTIEECERLLENGADLATERKYLRRTQKEAEKAEQNSKENEAKKGRDDVVKKDVNWTKVRRVLTCDDCSAPRCVFS